MVSTPISAGRAIVAVAVIGVIACGAAGTATAELVADKARVVDNDAGWQLRVTKTRESLDRFPNLAATMFTREPRLSDRLPGRRLQRTHHGPGPVHGPQRQREHLPVPAVTLGASAMVTPIISTTVKPGGITTIEFGTKPLAGPSASIAVDQVQIKVDACMGPVSLRSFATARISTALADDTVSVYGDPIYL